MKKLAARYDTEMSDGQEEYNSSDSSNNDDHIKYFMPSTGDKDQSTNADSSNDDMEVSSNDDSNDNSDDGAVAQGTGCAFMSKFFFFIIYVCAVANQRVFTELT